MALLTEGLVACGSPACRTGCQGVPLGTLQGPSRDLPGSVRILQIHRTARSHLYIYIYMYMYNYSMKACKRYQIQTFMSHPTSHKIAKNPRRR